MKRDEQIWMEGVNHCDNLHEIGSFFFSEQGNGKVTLCLFVVVVFVKV